MRKQILIAVALLPALGLGLDAPAAQSKTAAGVVSITSKSPQAVATFKTGRDLLDNVRTAEAMAEFKKSIELDPDFALAHAYLGSVTPGSEGLKELERGNALAMKLAEPERLEIQAMLADARGEEQKGRGLWLQLSKAAPGDWHVQFTLGGVLSGERKWGQAATALEKATALNPKAGVAYNSLGYAYLNQDKNEEAIKAFKKYSELRTDEPNPYDSLAEALMAAGRFEDAEANFRKALEISPQFYISSAGIAQIKFLHSDWTGGREALAQAKAAATRPVDKLGLDFVLAWSQLAAGQPDDAWKTLDALERQAKAEKLDATYAFVPIVRANMLLDAGKPEAALEQVAIGMERGQMPGMPGATMNGVRRAGLSTRTAAEARLVKVEDATKTLALLEAEAKAAPANAFLQSQLESGRGELALARSEPKAAAEAFARCIEQDTYSQWRRIVALEKAGDMDGAAQARKKLMIANRRDGEYLYVRSQLGAEPAAVQQKN